jgi:organic hydroperoxide reductase OsmC/OhrA
MATFLAIAANFKLEIKTFDCKTTIKLEVVEGKFLITEAELCPVVTLAQPETDTEKANRVLEKAKAGCLVTNSMKTTVSLKSTVL